MKKLFLLLIPFLFMGCSSGDDEGTDTAHNNPNNYWKLKSVTTSADESPAQFLYNSSGLLTEIKSQYDDYNHTLKYIYDGNKLTRTESYMNNTTTPQIEEFTYDGSLIVRSDKEGTYEEYIYNDAGQLIKLIEVYYDHPEMNGEVAYTYYNNGNLYSETSGSSYNTYEYDNKINPLYYALPEAYTKIVRLQKNNTTHRNGSTQSSYSYEYDGDYPVKMFSENSTTVSIYTYY